MDPNVFRQEIITTLEIELEHLKSNKPLDHLFLTELRDSLNHLAETTQTIRDNLPQ